MSSRAGPMICLNSIIELIDGQHDVADVAGIHAGRELLRRGQDRGDGLFVVLKVAQVLLAQLAVVGRYALAVVRIGARLDLVDPVPNEQGVGLVAQNTSVFSCWLICDMKISTRLRSRSRISILRLKSVSS